MKELDCFKKQKLARNALHQEYSSLVYDGEYHVVTLIPGIDLDCTLWWDAGTECSLRIDRCMYTKNGKGFEIVSGFINNGLHEDDLHDLATSKLNASMKKYNKRIEKLMDNCHRYWDAYIPDVGSVYELWFQDEFVKE